jgi:flagellar biosynthesis protein FlhG
MKIVTITSGKGGVGKTNVAVNLALALAKQGKRVLLVDADLGLANVDVLLGLRCRHTLSDVIDGTMPVEQVLADAPCGLKFLPAASGVLRLERLTPDQRAHLLSELRRLSESFELMLVDTGAGLTENVLFFCAAADQLLMVTTPEPTALTDSYALAKVLTKNYNIEGIALLVNQVVSATQGPDVHEKLDSVTQRFLQRGLIYFGAIPRDSALAQAVQDRKPVVLAHPRALTATTFVALADRFDQVFTRQRPKGNLWEELLGDVRGPHLP